MPKYKRRKTLLTLVTSYEDCKVDVTKKEYLEIVEGFMKFIMKKVFEGKEVMLPMSVGSLMVVGHKNKIVFDEQQQQLKGAPVDWVSTKKLWAINEEARKNKIRILFFNEHSNGISYKIKWLKGYGNMTNKSIYLYKPTRANKRKFGQLIKNGKEYKISQRSFEFYRTNKK